MEADVIGERNLAPERGPNVWRTLDERAAAMHVARWTWGLGGMALAGYGLWRHDRSGFAMLLFGAAVAAKAATGWRGEDEAQAWLEHTLRLVGWVPSRDKVGRQSDQSFPASDAPSWTSTTGTQH
jgi:hypothetical protein